MELACILAPSCTKEIEVVWHFTGGIFQTHLTSENAVRFIEEREQCEVTLHFAVNLLEGFVIEMVYLIVGFLAFGMSISSVTKRHRQFSGYRTLGMVSILDSIIPVSVLVYIIFLPILFIRFFHIPWWGILVGLGNLALFLDVGITIASHFEWGLAGIGFMGTERRYTRGWRTWASAYALSMFCVMAPIMLPINILFDRLHYEPPGFLIPAVLGVLGSVCILGGIVAGLTIHEVIPSWVNPFQHFWSALFPHPPPQG